MTDPAGNVYFCDRDNNVVGKIDTNGIITTVAGTGVAGYNGDNIPATQAQLNTPWRVTIDPAGNLYIADSLNDRIRKLAPNGIITTVMGNGQPGYSGDGGSAISATLRIPEQAELDVAGNLYISTAAGIYNNFSYTGDGGPAAKATFNGPAGIAMDTAGNLYITDFGNNVLRVLLSDGTIQAVAGDGSPRFAGDGGPATKAGLNSPRQMAVGTFGDVYIADSLNNAIRKLTPSSPTLGRVTNAFGDVALVSQNTWIAIKGTGLARPGDSRIWLGKRADADRFGWRQRDLERIQWLSGQRLYLLHQPRAD